MLHNCLQGFIADSWSLFVVFIISKVGVTECAWLGWRQTTWQRPGGEFNSSVFQRFFFFIRESQKGWGRGERKRLISELVIKAGYEILLKHFWLLSANVIAPTCRLVFISWGIFSFLSQTTWIAVCCNCHAAEVSDSADCGLCYWPSLAVRQMSEVKVGWSESINFTLCGSTVLHLSLGLASRLSQQVSYS